MKKRWWITVLALFPGSFAGAQAIKPVASSFLPVAVRAMPLAPSAPGRTTYTGFALKPVKLLPVAGQKFPVPAAAPTTVYRMASDAYYQQHFGFFCKQEWSWQKQTGIPVKFRLGSYSYAQQQEGKH